MRLSGAPDVCVRSWRIVASGSAVGTPKRADGIVEREAPLLGAPQHHGRGNRLRQAIGVERGVGAGRERSADVLLAVGALPHDAVGIDNGGSQAGNAGLVAQGIKIGAEDFVDDALRLRRHAEEQQRGDEGGKASTAHLLAAIVPELSRFGERNFGGKLNCRIDIGAPHLNAVLVRERRRQQRPRRNLRSSRAREASAPRSRPTGRVVLVARIRRRLGFTLPAGFHPVTANESHRENHNPNKHACLLRGCRLTDAARRGPDAAVGHAPVSS